MAKSKGSNKVNKMMYGPYDVTGDRGDYVRALSQNPIDVQSKATVFSSGIELYITAAIVGVLYDQRKEPMRSDEKDFSIFGEQFKNHYDDIKLAYQLVMLNHEKERTTARERINNAFKYVVNPEDEVYQRNIDIFESYILGGIDYLYDYFINETNRSFDDFLNSAKEFINLNQNDEMGDRVDESEEMDFSDPIF